MQKVAVVITTWKRFEHLEETIKKFMEEPECGEIFIWDNSNGFVTDLPITVLRCNKNYGAHVRWIFASIAKEEIICFVDDDLSIKPGLLCDFLKYYEQDRILGVCGRKWTDSYQSGFKAQFDGDKITDAVSVDFIVGFFLLINRKHLIGQYYGDDPQEACEVSLQGRLKHLEKIVVPTKNWYHLPEQWDKNALSSRPHAIGVKEQEFQKYFGRK